MKGIEIGLIISCVVMFLAGVYLTYIMWIGAKWRGATKKGKDREDFETREMKVSHNYFMGVWLRLVEGSRSGSYDMYKLLLDKQQTTVLYQQVKSPWCRTYRAAQQIFSDPGSAAVRKMINGQHSTLYRQAGFRRSSTLYISTKELLFQYLGINPYSKTLQMFTYVLLPCSELRFSTTGKNALRDVLSKHAVHANCIEEVIYAGEFNFMDGCLFIDNASGTFSPNKKYLPIVRDFVAQHFKGLPVGFMDFTQREDFFKDMKDGKGFGSYNRHHESVVVAQVLDPHERRVRLDSLKKEKRKSRELQSVKSVGGVQFSSEKPTFSSPQKFDSPFIEMSPTKVIPNIAPPPEAQPEHTAVVIPTGAGLPIDKNTPEWVGVEESYEAFVYHAFSDDGLE